MDESLQASLRHFLNDEQRRNSALLSSGYQGSAYLYESGDTRLVIKEAAGGLLTGWFHRQVLRREAHAYQLMRDVAGVPHSPGMLDNTFLILEYIDGRSLQVARHELRGNTEFYARLKKIISDFHAVGVAHGDLKRKDNMLVMAGDLPVIIDFGTAVTRNGNLFDRLMFRLVRRFDNNAWIKLKYNRDYAAITEEDRQWYRPTIVEETVRVIQRVWRVVTFRQARKRRQRSRQKPG